MTESTGQTIREIIEIEEPPKNMANLNAPSSGNGVRITGWEVAEHHEKRTVRERMRLGEAELSATLMALFGLVVVFAIGCWLAGNPFDTTARIASPALSATEWNQTGGWNIIWTVVLLAVVFEFLDASAGMGYGTAFTPLLLLLGYEPLQIIPAIMIQQACAGLISAYLHRQFGNVEWRLKPMSETIRLWLIIGGMGILAVAFSITSIYGVLQLGKVYIKLYVIILLLVMAGIALLSAGRNRQYRPRRMYLFGALAGFNKGIGGGGYGPVVTVGGMLSGVPAKTMMAVTALSEGTVCVASIVVWFFLLHYGVIIDFILLPSMLLGTMVSVLLAPYATRVVPEKAWKIVVPAYCLLLAVISMWKLLSTW